MNARIGIYNLRMSGGGGGQKRTLAVAEHLSHRHRVFLIVGEDCQVDALQDYFHVDLSRVELVRVRSAIAACLNRIDKGGSSAENFARLTESGHFRTIQSLELDLFINFNWASNLLCPAPRGIYMCMFPHGRRGVPQGNDLRSRVRSRLLGIPQNVVDSYDIITANSKFTAGWVERMWGREAVVTYSASEPMGPAVEKERLIVHTGRFVEEGRADSKQQRLLLRVFEQMTDLKTRGWMLHFAGTVLPGRAAQRTASELVKLAGSSVKFHFDASFKELRDLYRRASIYWHATGYGWPPERHPERQEHFGITTVEAMSAGAVPVVINSGGQRETVEHGVSGFLWNDPNDLEEYTRRLAGDDALRQQMEVHAIRRSERFGRSEFLRRMDSLVDQLLSGESGRGIAIRDPLLGSNANLPRPHHLDSSIQRAEA
jgi:glycosyltransferase involved in cell wall biosynthesis